MDVGIIFQLILATVLGALIGLERESKRKEAGIQTYSLVSLGTCLFTIISFELVDIFANQSAIGFDPLRIIQAIAVGIGFVGAGVIFRHGSGVVGLTTAAGLWATASIGILVGAGIYGLAIISTVLVLFILTVFGLLEMRFFEKNKK